MDRAIFGERLARAREDAGMTQDGLSRAARLEDGAVSELEHGERAIDVREIVAVAQALGRPMSVLVAAPVPAAVSRRQDTDNAHETTRALDIELEAFAADVRTLSEIGLVETVARTGARLPGDHDATERVAREARERAGLGEGPVPDLAEVTERLGLYVFSASLGTGGPDGACVEVHDGSLTLGACVLNGDAPAGRRRMTTAHELGHWLNGDAYDATPSASSEQMVNSFAIHFLAPRAGVKAVWAEYDQYAVRDRALAVAARFRVSWSAAVNQLQNLDLIDVDQHRELRREEPRRGDYSRLGLTFTTELAAPSLSPCFVAGDVNGYVGRWLTADRAVELLRGTLDRADLPDQDPPTFDDLRPSFVGHDG